MRLLLAADLEGGGAGGIALQAALVVTGASLALAFSPLVHNALVRVPLHQAADASGLFTTVLQLSQAVGIAVFGSVFLTLDTSSVSNGTMAEISGHALALTLCYVAVTAGLGVAGAVPLARTVHASLSSHDAD